MSVLTCFFLSLSLCSANSPPGFQGPTITDWGGAWDTFNLSTNGLVSNQVFGSRRPLDSSDSYQSHFYHLFNSGDVEMPGSAYDQKYGNFFGAELVELVKNGSIPEARVDDQALRLLGTAMSLQDLDSWPEPSFDVRDLTLPTNNVKKDHHQIIRKIGEESVTLLKNNRTGTLGLPFRDLYEMQSVAVIGQDAGPNPRGESACGQDRNNGMCDPNGNTGTITAGGGSVSIELFELSIPFPLRLTSFFHPLSTSSRDGLFPVMLLTL